jgi:peptidyl-tRNA hydrolase, PTH1 family
MKPLSDWLERLLTPQHSPVEMSDRYLIVGLGNPGKQYENTRHNVGYRVIHELARRHGFDSTKTERRALTADGLIREKRVLLAQPLTYMNLSGEAVRGLLDFYKITQERIIVIHDDLDIPLGTLRLRKTGGAGGQKGIRSIIQHLGTQDFSRVRVGIGRPPGRMDPSAYVLQPFRGDDEVTAKIVIDRAADAVECWLTDGIELAMTRYNGSID